jgi:hypothetical protein
VINRIRDLYSRATIFALIRRTDPGWDNVYTTVIYGSDLTAWSAFDVLTKNDDGELYEAHRVVVDSAAASDFAERARSAGSAMLPGTDRAVAYTAEVCYDAFLPRSEYPERQIEYCSSTWSCWRRRATARTPSLGKHALSEETVADIGFSLPLFDDADFSQLNVASDLTRLQAIDEVFPVPLTVDLRGGDRLSYSIEGNDSWIERFAPLSLAVDTFEYGLRVGAHHMLVSAHQGTLPITASSSANAILMGEGGALLDQSGGTFIRRVGVSVGLTPAPIRLHFATESLDIPVAPRTRSETSVGANEPLADLFTRRRLAEKWRELVRAHEQFNERVFDGSRQMDCRAEGISLLSKIVTVAGEPGTIVKIVDPFALDAQALIALVPIAAGIPNAEIWILTENKRASPAQMSELSDDAAFAAVAGQIAKHLGVKIRVFKPTIPLHDRFLQIGNRNWHVGHSFNRFGCDLSAIVELRDPHEIRKLLALFDQQFVGGGELYE